MIFTVSGRGIQEEKRRLPTSLGRRAGHFTGNDVFVGVAEDGFVLGSGLRLGRGKHLVGGGRLGRSERRYDGSASPFSFSGCRVRRALAAYLVAGKIAPRRPHRF